MTSLHATTLPVQRGKPSRLAYLALLSKCISTAWQRLDILVGECGGRDGGRWGGGGGGRRDDGGGREEDGGGGEGVRWTPLCLG